MKFYKDNLFKCNFKLNFINLKYLYTFFTLLY